MGFALSVSKVLCFRLAFLGILLLPLTNSPALAEPSVLGVFSGTLNGTTPFLSGGTSGAPTTQTVTITITSQTGPTIIGNISVSPAGLSTTFDGTINAAGFVDATFNASSTVLGFGGFTGDFNGSTLSIPSGVGSLVIENLLMTNYDLGGSLNFSGSGSTNIDPAVAPGTTIKDAGTIQSEILGVVTPIQQHLVKTLRSDARGFNLDEQGFLLEAESGLNAGDIQLGDVGIWLSYNYRDIENDFTATAFESHSHTAIGGIDFSPNDRMVFGLAFAYEYSDTDTTFNLGNLESDGFTIAPYFGVLLSDTWSLDASLGASFIDNDQFRTDPITAARVSSDPDTDRFFIAANLNGITYLDNWVLGGRIGYLFAKSTTDDFIESNGTAVAKRKTKLGQIRIGGDVAYSYQNWEPFISATYEYDYLLDEIVLVTGPQPANDRDDILFATGFRYFNDSGFSSSFEYSKRFLREDFDEDSFSLSLRYDF